jgi:hypothetical protein
MGFFFFDWMTIGIVLFAIVIGVAERKRRLRNRLRLDEVEASRPLLSASDFAAECGITPEIADRVRRVLAAVSESSYGPPKRPVDPQRIHPRDTLGEDLGFSLDSLSWLEMLNGLENEFGVRKIIKRLPEWPPVTAGDIARAVAAGLEASQPD